MMKKFLLIAFISLTTVSFCFAQKDYKVSFFGIKDDGVTNNTSSIQFAIDYISSHGGGSLNFYVGRYLTGSLELKDNVTIHLHEGAIIDASPIVNDFLLHGDQRALFYGEDLSNVTIKGKGVIEAKPEAYFKQTRELRSRNLLDMDYLSNTPTLLTLKNCKNIKIDGVIFQKALELAQKYIGCEQVELNNLSFRFNKVKDGALINFQNTKGISLTNIYIETKGQAVVKDNSSTITKVENSKTSEGKSII